MSQADPAGANRIIQAARTARPSATLTPRCKDLPSDHTMVVAGLVRTLHLLD